MKTTQYVVRQSDDNGLIHYPEAEYQAWNTLTTRQLKVIGGRACQEYLDGIEQFGLPHDRIPQLDEINRVLQTTTDWRAARAPVLIPFQTFFELLVGQQFPIATFIRTPEELNYLQEPDIFHEIFDHCPLLTNPWFAEFTRTYGKLGLKVNKEERTFFARLYWVTIEFGLVEIDQDKCIYGGGILSSPKGTVYCFSDEPLHRASNPLEVIRTPYHVDILQLLYFVLPDLKRLFQLAQENTMALVHEAMRLDLHVPLFPPKQAAWRELPPPRLIPRRP